MLALAWVTWVTHRHSQSDGLLFGCGNVSLAGQSSETADQDIALETDSAASSNASSTVRNGTADDVLRIISDLPVRAIAAGAHHSVLLTAEGDVFTWGANAGGGMVLGVASGQLELQKVAANSTTADVRHVFAGADHSFAVDAVGAIVAWGDNSWAQLGVGSAQACWPHT
jgi:alpha-tubulin suppressor-like RCC1 family protein